uniref:CNH domain-containing protein n=2 Tax=Caenorhabditis tropicalis TaxID=1561998 RepID=A0A1I7USB5_9PELO
MMDVDLRVHMTDNTITKSSITSAFLLPDNAIVVLSYERNGRRLHCLAKHYEKTFLVPDDWQELQFFVESNKKSPRCGTSLNIEEKLADDLRDRLSFDTARQ